MPLYEFYCTRCQRVFEALASLADGGSGTCPDCDLKSEDRRVSRFFTQGRGDVRETGVFHGCEPTSPDSDHEH